MSEDCFPVLPKPNAFDAGVFAYIEAFISSIQIWELAATHLIVVPGRGEHDLQMDGGLPPGFQKGTLF